MCPKGQTDSGQEYGRPRQTHHCEGTRRAADMGIRYRKPSRGLVQFAGSEAPYRHRAAFAFGGHLDMAHKTVETKESQLDSRRTCRWSGMTAWGGAGE